MASPSAMASTRLILNPHPATTRRSNPKPCRILPFTAGRTRRRGRLITCKAIPPSSSSFIMELDLYDLLGIESSSDQPGIKNAYRMLQKRCHPDVVGPVGHDMAIVLNEAYALLSDPASRAAYDKEQAKKAEMRGYTGRPIYSSWFGSESEQRAVFVDEVKCIGCLKCALFASKTFAIEAVYGRARVIGQWADPEDVIQEAVDACPVNCIYYVERSDLPALEFLMSKQPRGRVRVGVGNTVGERVSDIFSEVESFKKRLDNTEKKGSSEQSKGQDLERDRTMSAVQAIQSISNWLYQHPTDVGSSHIQLVRSQADPRVDKLRMAAAARKHASMRPTISNRSYSDEYWAPLTPVLVPGDPQKQSVNTPSSETIATNGSKKSYYEKKGNRKQNKVQYARKRPLVLGIPVGTSAIGAFAVGLQGGQDSGLTDHVGGYIALEVVNSFWLQIGLAGATWYIVGIAIVNTIEVFGGRGSNINES